MVLSSYLGPVSSAVLDFAQSLLCTRGDVGDLNIFVYVGIICSFSW